MQKISNHNEGVSTTHEWNDGDNSTHRQAIYSSWIHCLFQSISTDNTGQQRLSASHGKPLRISTHSKATATLTSCDYSATSNRNTSNSTDNNRMKDGRYNQTLQQHHNRQTAMTAVRICVCLQTKSQEARHCRRQRQMFGSFDNT
jgi:hypothetical protein